jgi:glutaredoxin
LGTAAGALLGWHSLRTRLTRDEPNAAAEPSREPPAQQQDAEISVPEPAAAPDRAFVTSPQDLAPRNAPVPAPSTEAPAGALSAEIAAPATAPFPTAAPTPSGPSPEQIQAAVVSTRIVMYSAAWCGVCQRAKAFLRQNGLSYENRDIDENPAARAELKRRTGGAAIPVLEIGGTLLKPGFSERSVERALVQSVEQRLGVRGIRLQTSR